MSLLSSLPIPLLKRRRTVQSAGPSPVLLWPTRVLYILAVISGVFLLIFDSPIPLNLSSFVSRAVVEAAPLLLVGVAFLAWLAVDRPPIVDLIKQAFIAIAFILWGVDLLIPPGAWATFIGAVVIAIYVFDLAWLMEGNLRKKLQATKTLGPDGCKSEDCKSAGVCRCNDASPGANRT